MEQCQIVLNRKTSATCILKGDIRGWFDNISYDWIPRIPRNISELCRSLFAKTLICRHGLKNAGEVVLVVFFIGECDSDSMGVDLSGRNFAKTIAEDLGIVGCTPVFSI
jgi:hypothetical protein